MTQILQATLLVGGICSALAALLVLAERYLVHYGPCTIDVNDGARRLDVQGGKTLLASLMEQGIFIPSACGGRGTCAYCKLKVTQGGGPIVPTEEPLLTDEEKASNVRLSCQIKVRSDIAVDIPEELFLVREYTGVVERIRDLTHDMKELRIRLTEPDTIEFVPGRYVQLETPAYGHVPEPIYRAYSVASPPSDDRAIELIIRLAPGGICTTWVFTILKEGDEVRLNGPYGEFGLTDSDKPMVWIAGGSGMAPFWSMARHMVERGIQRPCTYFFGALARHDLFFVEEFRQIEQQLPNFQFVPALSAAAADDRWDGKTGLITDVLDRHVADGSATEFYLCGSGGMIDAAAKVILSKGATEEQIFYDKFT